MPGTREGGLVDELEAGGELKGAPGLVSGGTGGDGMARLAAVRAKPGVEAAAAFVLGKSTSEPAGGVDVHGGGGRSGKGLTGGGGVVGEGFDVGLKLRSGRGRVLASAAGGVGRRLILLHGDGCCDVRLKGRGRGTTAGKFESYNLF